ncbi:N/A [soil metagenome]
MDIGLIIIYILVGMHVALFVTMAAAWMLYRFPYRERHDKSAWPAVSIIICAHNEDENLRHNLPAILAQKYGEWEVIVVNDRSTDLTGKVLEVFQRKYDNLWVVNVVGQNGNKKNALDEGIKAAKHNIVLLTDADCRPQSHHWIQAMATCFKEGIDIVLGFSPFPEGPGLLNKVIRFETLYTAFLYGGMALLKQPYMGVGRNLAYRKSVYLKATAPTKYKSTLSGDDDLVINEMANGNNTTICAVNQGIVWSAPKTTWASWWHQKRRHTGASVHYKPSTKLLLLLTYVPIIVLYPLIISFLVTGIVFNPIYIIYAGALLAVRLVLLLVGLPAPINVLEQASLLPFLLLCDFLISFILFSLGCLTAIKVHTWTNQHPHNVHKKT